MTTEQQTRVTTGEVTELQAALWPSMNRKFHKIEYNTIPSKTTTLDPRLKKLAFNENRAADETLQRIAAAAARHGQLTPLPEGQEGEEATENEQEEPLSSVVWSFLEKRAAGDSS